MGAGASSATADIQAASVDDIKTAFAGLPADKQALLMGLIAGEEPKTEEEAKPAEEEAKPAEGEAKPAGDADECLRGVFDMYDLDKSGKISCKELKNIFEKAGQTPPSDEMIAEIMKNNDKNDDSHFDFDEFKTMFP